MRVRRAAGLDSAFGGNAYAETEADNNPNAYLVNLADCMLVLACGIIVALVIAWDVRLPGAEQVEATEEMVELEDVEELAAQLQQGGDTYTQRGRVYEDPVTGKLYMVEDAGE
jgi:hypothetical protein